MCVDLREWENRYHVLRERAGGGSVFGSAGVGAVGVLLFVVVVVLFMLGGGGGIRKKNVRCGCFGNSTPQVSIFVFLFFFFSFFFRFSFSDEGRVEGRQWKGRGWSRRENRG